MQIKDFLLDTYPVVSPYEGINVIQDKLVEERYLVVMDEKKNFYGILTPSDLVIRPHKLVIDCLCKKESISVEESVQQMIEKFYTSHAPALPLYQGETFLGILEGNNILNKMENKARELVDVSRISQNLKNEFLKNLSHEIRTPLNSILGFLEIISNLKLEKFKTDGEKYYSIVQRSADRFLLIMNDLMSLSLIHSGDNIKVERENVRIETIFADLKEYFEIEALYLKRELTIHFANPDSSFILYTDGGKIKHILYHLIDNAIKYSKGKSNVLFGYTLSANDSVVDFFVSNTGSHIPEAEKQKIFDIFEKTDKLSDGLGIGLPLAKKLIGLLGGTIELISNKDEDKVTFKFSIPVFHEPSGKEIPLFN
ncbi:MAG: HAMP domain-containing histidine kinase [Bacteroidales bacterium]|nr:HAMP domain-containing histidine kinase [Bacteroidales bacterium]